MIAIKTKYKYINFVQSEWGDAWLCKNNKTTTILAHLYYYKDWKQYVVAFDKHAVFSADCLVDIVDFQKQLNQAIEFPLNAVKQERLETSTAPTD